MKLSLHWLGDHVDLSGLSPEEIAEQLTMKIALIEGIERPGEAVRDVRVGHVLEAVPHPNADRLRLCKLSEGGEPLDVVCGAPNVAAGQKVAFAPPGAELPGGFKLEKRKIRGIVSNGMICSEREMGLGDSHEGILVLPEDTAVGTPLAQVLGLDDVLFEIDNKTVTHRADLWGHYGFARELAAIFDRPRTPYPVAEDLERVSDAFPIRIEDTEACPLYLGLLIDGVSGEKASPGWLVRRLLSAEMRPINLLVDLSNYVMLDLGQPTHPFDRDTLKGGVVVRRARAGETLTTLDGQERELVTEDLMIADEEESVAIAGVMGGGPTEVSGRTERVLLESAHFDAVRVRRTSSRLGLRTDAVARFEKFLDPGFAEIAVRRYAHLLRELAPEATIHAGFAGDGAAVERRPRLQLRPERVRTKLGYAIEDEEVAQRLRSVEFEVDSGGESFEVTVPSFRAGRDIRHEDDLIEEVGRLAGYERAPSVLPKVSCAPPVLDPLRRLERDALRSLVHECGYTETLNYSFATDRQAELYHDADEPFLRLPHPITQDAGRLRRSLVPGMLEQLSRNQLHRDELRMVEIGRSYWAEGGDEELPRERRELVAARSSRARSGEESFFEVRADTEALFRRLRLSVQADAPERAPRFAHPTRCIEWSVAGSAFAWTAELHPELIRPFDLDRPTALLFVDLGVLVRTEREVVKMAALPQFPSVRRDVALVAPLDVTVGSVLEDVHAASPEQVVGAELFDVYQGENIPQGHRSLAFRIEYRKPDGTLTDKEVEVIHGKVLRRLKGRGLEPR